MYYTFYISYVKLKAIIFIQYQLVSRSFVATTTTVLVLVHRGSCSHSNTQKVSLTMQGKDLQ